MRVQQDTPDYVLRFYATTACVLRIVIFFLYSNSRHTVYYANYATTVYLYLISFTSVYKVRLVIPCTTLLRYYATTT